MLDFVDKWRGDNWEQNERIKHERESEKEDEIREIETQGESNLNDFQAIAEIQIEISSKLR